MKNRTNRDLKRNTAFENFMFFLFHSVVIFIAFIFQTSIFPLMPFFKSTPNFLLIIVFTYGLLYGETVGVFTGIFCGLLFDMYFDEPFGVYILIYASLGYLNGALNRSFYGDSISFPMILSIINSFVFNIYIYIVHFFVRGRFNILYCFFNVMMPNILFTLIATIFIYRFLYDKNALEV